MPLIHSLLWSFCLSLALAIEMPVYIKTPSKVTAGKTFQASLTAEVHNGGTRWVKFFRVYLATSYQEKAHYFYDADCHLIYEQSLCDASIEIAGDYVSLNDTPFNVTIPSTVGPSGAHYVLTAQIHQTDGSRYGSSLDSEVFELTDANGTWSEFQTEGLGSTLWGDDGISCGGYDCVKNCADSLVHAKNQTQYHDCANNCPGVSIDWSSSVGGQPTASRTKPPACDITATATATDAQAATDARETISATQMRSPTGAAGSSAAPSTLPCSRLLSACLMSLAILFFLRW